MASRKQRVTLCGVDIGALALTLAVSRGGAEPTVHTFENTAAGRKRLKSFIVKRSRKASVLLEATGNYGLDLALLLHRSKLQVFVVNPIAARAYARARMFRAKTDKVDALVLLAMARDMPLEVWVPPSESALALRAITRRVRALKDYNVSEANRSHAAGVTATTPELLQRSIDRIQKVLDEEIETLLNAAKAVVDEEPELTRKYELLISVRGIARDSALELLGELCVLPDDLTIRQLVAHTGLDPRPKQSGTIDGPRRISKWGNRRLRAALWMPAVNVVRHNVQCAAFKEKLVARGLKPKQAYTAVMRKLLHAFHGMFRSNTTWDADRFYAV